MKKSDIITIKEDKKDYETVPRASDNTVKETRNDVLGALKQSKLSDKLRQDLADSADVEELSVSGFEDKEVIKIDVKNQSEWSSEPELRKFAKYFGEILFHSYKDREDKTPYKPEDPVFMEKFLKENIFNTDWISAKNIYAVTEHGRVQGLAATKEIVLEDGTKADEVMLVAVMPEEQKTGLGKKIRKFCFQNSNKDIIVSASHTPAAVKNVIEVSGGEGWDTYYCGRLEGDASKELKPDEKRKVQIAYNGLITEALKDPDLRDLQIGVPEHYLSYGNLGIPPRHKEELKFKTDDPLKETFEDLIGWQQKNRPGHCIYGLLCSIKRSTPQKLQ